MPELEARLAGAEALTFGRTELKDEEVLFLTTGSDVDLFISKREFLKVRVGFLLVELELMTGDPAEPARWVELGVLLRVDMLLPCICLDRRDCKFKACCCCCCCCCC